MGRIISDVTAMAAALIFSGLCAVSAQGAGMTFGARHGGAGFNASSMKRMDTEAGCTSALSRKIDGSGGVTGLYCRLSGTTMNIYLALSDEAILEIAQDPHAATNLAAVRDSFLSAACRRDSMLLQGAYSAVNYRLVNKNRQEIASYTIRRSECGR